VEGKPVRMIGSMQDITDHVQQVREIEEQNNQLKQISWIQSHKVRGPLARILGITALIGDENLSVDEKAEFTADLKIAAQELDKILEDIVSRTEFHQELKLTTPAFNIKKLRIQRGWSQKQVAEQLKVSQNAYSKWENSKADLSFSRLSQLADLYGISVTDLITKY
jgi:DNA-binding XRE family transcriptional regulator